MAFLSVVHFFLPVYTVNSVQTLKGLAPSSVQRPPAHILGARFDPGRERGYVRREELSRQHA
jgi:hypothetical protein